MRRIIPILLVVIMVLTGCLSNENNVVEIDREVSIIYYKNAVPEELIDFIKYHSKTYSDNTGVKVVIEPYEGIGFDDYYQKRDSKMYLTDGPTLVLENTKFIDRWMENEGFWQVESDDIPNYSNTIPELRTSQFIPLTAYIPAFVFNLEEYGENANSIEFSNAKEYLQVMTEYMDDNPRRFDIFEYRDLHNMLLENVEYIDESGNIDLDNESVIDYFKELRQLVLSDRYYFDSNDDMDYVDRFKYDAEKNYENLMSDYKFRNENQDNYLILNMSFNSANALNPLNLNTRYSSEIAYVPNFMTKSMSQSFGVLINRNGKNIKDGKDFVNFLLSEDVQFDLFKKGMNYKYFAPVTNEAYEAVYEYEMDNGIDNELIELRQYVVDRLTNGQYNVAHSISRADSRTTQFIREFGHEYVFTEKYIEDAILVAYLKEKEDELNIYNE